MVTNHLSCLTFDNNKLPIKDYFPNEQLFSIQSTLWCADIENFLHSNRVLMISANFYMRYAYSFKMIPTYLSIV